MKNLMPEEQQIYTVSQLNTEARLIVEETFDTIWLTGEVSNLTKHTSGHFYFSLKDERSRIRCAFFRNHQRKIKFNLENGQQVLVRAQASIYEAQGSFQLIVQHIEIAGTGALQIAFEQLKKNLEKEGLFSAEFKKEIPSVPNTIGIVTSSTAAALRDILKVLNRRFPSIPVIIYPTMVQGNKAAAQISAAIECANHRSECDVLILARGGGSLEDLWPFNEEIVARAIFNSTIPIITGIGHEIDFTIADFVADYRAATPSAAAECVSPDKAEWQQLIHTLFNRLRRTIHNELRHYRQNLENLTKRLQHPGKRLEEYRTQINTLKHRLNTATNNDIRYKQELLNTLAKSLHALSPLSTLDRGFALVTASNTQKILRKASDINIGDAITARLSNGSLDCKVEKIHEK